MLYCYLKLRGTLFATQSQFFKKCFIFCNWIPVPVFHWNECVHSLTLENVYKSICWPLPLFICKWRVRMQNCKLEECYIFTKVCLMFRYVKAFPFFFFFKFLINLLVPFQNIIFSSTPCVYITHNIATRSLAALFLFTS